MDTHTRTHTLIVFSIFTTRDFPYILKGHKNLGIFVINYKSFDANLQ